VTFRELAVASARFANLLRSYAIGRGDVVAGLLPRIPELLVAVLVVFALGLSISLCSRRSVQPQSRIASLLRAAPKRNSS
jgi:acyl-coenzyme A synthetase/AMP-(fatty) acid ligase